MIWASDSCCAYILGDELWVDIVGDDDLCDCTYVLMFSCVGSPHKTHDVDSVHLVMQECCEHGSGMVLLDYDLLFTKRVFIRNPHEIR